MEYKNAKRRAYIRPGVSIFKALSRFVDGSY
jgi:hypothetical protein